MFSLPAAAALPSFNAQPLTDASGKAAAIKTAETEIAFYETIALGNGSILTAARQSDNGFGFQSSVSFASSRDMNSNERVTNNGGSGGSVTNNPADPHANYAPGDYDVKFRGVFAGYCPIIWGVKGMAMVTYQSGLPYSATTAQDRSMGMRCVARRHSLRLAPYGAL